jgi:hypothetical protein
MRDAIPEHPLTKPFWKRKEKSYPRNNSLTEDDFNYTIRLDEELVELTEEQVCSFSSVVTGTRTLKGRWEPLRVTQENVALRLSGVDSDNVPIERVLVIWDDEIDYFDLPGWLKSSQRIDNDTLTIEPAEAAARGLPPLGIRICYARLPFRARAFPDPRTYLSLSFCLYHSSGGRPPFLSVHPLPPEVRDAASLEALVKQLFGAESGFVLGGNGELGFRGRTCLAQLHSSGTQDTAATVCSLAVPGESGGVLLVFGRGGAHDSVKDVRAVAECVPIARLLKRLTWEPAG